MVKYILRVSLILGLMIYIASAKACDYPIKVDDNGTNCTGVLLSETQFIKAGNDSKKVRLQDLKIAEYEGLEEIYDMRHKHYREELKTAKRQLKWHEFKSNVGYVISFSLGAVITGVIAKEVLK